MVAGRGWWAVRRAPVLSVIGLSLVMAMSVIAGAWGLASSPGSASAGLVSTTPASDHGGFATGMQPTLVQPDAATVSISEDGASPEGISLVAQVSGNWCAPHSWTFYWSPQSSNGPWQEVGSYTTSSDPLSAGFWGVGGMNYWYVVDDDSCTGNMNSNTLQFTQPAVATLNGQLATPTSVTLSWNNLASYGDQVSFGSYTVDQSISGGTWTPVTSITTVSSTAYTVSALSPGTGYAFRINTTDMVSGSESTSFSNDYTITTPSPLSATVTASPTSVSTGQTVDFTCAASGGESPYSYSWSFGDSTTGTGQSPSHSYSTAGTYDVTCTVTDSFGTTASGAAVVTVTSSSGNGNGNGNGGGSSGSSTSSSGLDMTDWALIAVVIVVVAVAAVVLAVRRKPKSPQSPAAFQPPAQQPPSPPST